MAITARFLRSFVPALVCAGLALAACSSDSEDPPPDTNEPSDGGSDSNGGGTAGSPPEQPEAGSPSGGSGGTGGSGGSNVGGDTDVGTGGTPSEPITGGAGGEGPVPGGPTEGFLRGEQLAKDKICTTCHQADFGGIGIWPNITPDESTGIGSWTDEEIGAAIRDGEDPAGGALCSQMMKYPFTDPELADLIEYLRGIPAVSRKITAACPQ